MRYAPAAILVICATCLWGGGEAAATSGWIIVPGVNPGTNSILRGVAAISANDVWAVGDYFNGTNEIPLIEHWDGTQWSQVALLVPPNHGAYLNAIAAVSPTDIWVVGQYFSNNPYGKTLTIHWDGVKWSVIPSPNTGLYDGDYLLSVSAISSNDVWAVGNTNNFTKALVMHWDGTQWSLVPPAVPPNLNSIEINGVAATGSHDVWLVGSVISNYVGALLTEHWNGTMWKIVPASGCCYFTAITHDSGPKMVAVGQYYNPMAQEWNGSAWIALPPPVVPANSTISAITASPTAGVWSAGSANHSAQTLTLHGNVVVPSPNALLYNVLTAVSTVPGTGDVWAVGYAYGNVTGGVLIEYYSP